MKNPFRIRKNAADGKPFWVQDTESIHGCGFVESFQTRAEAQSCIDAMTRTEDEEGFELSDDEANA